AARLAAARRRNPGAALEAVRFVLPLRRAGVRRRARRAAAAASRGGAARLGVERCLSRRLRCGAGGAGAAVHVLGLSRHGDGTGAEWLGRRRDLPRRDLPAVVPATDRRAAVLGPAAAAPGCAIGAARGERGSRRAAARRALSPG